MKKFIKQIIKEALDEALKDELPDYMINAVKANNPDYADKFLNMDVPKHTELIPNLKLEINEPNFRDRFIKEIQNHFSKSILEQFHKTKLYEIFSKNQDNILLALFKGLNDVLMYKIFSKDNVKIDIIDKLKILYSKEFPLLQGKGNPDVITNLFIFKPIFSNNKSNIFGFIKSFNIAFPKYKIDLNPIMNDRVFQGLREPIMNYEQNVMDLANSKLYLYITDKPADILRMSVSQFYSSCQNLYSGRYNEKLLSNVFDENSKIAYLIFDSPYVDNQGNKHPFSSIARTIIRIGRDNKLLFDKTYPSNFVKACDASKKRQEQVNLPKIKTIQKDNVFQKQTS